METLLQTFLGQNTAGGAVAEWEVRLAPDQADWVRAPVRICIVFRGKNMTVSNITVMAAKHVITGR